MLIKRFLCTQTAGGGGNGRGLHRHRWPVKQVTKSNFSEALDEIKSSIFNSDYVAVSLQNTGGHSAPWQKLLPIDTVETAYMKAKNIAERFQILQFAVCPFSVKASKLIAHPYNFHLFPRDELKIGMPSYSFSCQSSYLTSMAREGFDFNACIYNGISYLSKAQESGAKVQFGHLTPGSCTDRPSSSLVYSVADTLFMERIKSRVRNWRNACKDPSNATEVADALISSLRNLVSGNEVFSSRPSLTIDVCSERQVPLVMETLKEFDDVVTLPVASGVGVQAVRVVLTSSAEDKNQLEKEIKDMEEEKRRLVHGFREVIDLISTSQKPVIVHNSLADFTFIHSKFLAPLPMTIDEFMSSLLSEFPQVIDVNHLMEEVGMLEKMSNMQSATALLDSRFFVPVEMDILNRGKSDDEDVHGHKALRVSRLFLKLCSTLKIRLDTPDLVHTLRQFSNRFTPQAKTSPKDSTDNVGIWKDRMRTVGVESLVFLWGFQRGASARDLKDVISDDSREDFDVRMVDATCAVVVFWNPEDSEQFLKGIDSGEGLSGGLKDMISEGLQAAGYETYKRACCSGMLNAPLAECLDLVETKCEDNIDSKLSSRPRGQSVVIGCRDDVIELDDL
ncbi:poly(A)-specific ribonuclease PARN-like [Andrographis paniculata]|uniref:poly(A)-specific ribonuclease PARN-like n=1 Tax=Andrographis paniculata TaxID=175694 RepID=UPI0021E77C60|nr:poly(A)-specific ribonuclease PARN-like [Andrographis paniculata]